MYTGKLKRLRKHDLYQATTYTASRDHDASVLEIALEDAGGIRHGLIKDSFAQFMYNGDSLEVHVAFTLRDENGDVIVTSQCILLPEVDGRTYYWVDDKDV